MNPALEWTVSEHTVVDGVYTIRLNRPDKRNALSPQLYHEIKLGVLCATGRDDVDMIVIEGGGGAFAAGGDLQAFLDILELPTEEFLPAYYRSFVEPVPFRVILECPKPVIAKIDGWCVAGGLVIASVADIAIATHRSSFGVPEARVGLADPYCSTLLPLAVGLPRARYMMLTAAMIDGRTAADWGLIIKSVEDEGALDKAVDEMTAALRTTSPEGRRAYKHVANQVIPHMSPEAVLRPVMSANGREGLSAFVDKRPAAWTNGGPIM